MFFELEPTLQPNLTNSVDRPGAGVSVSDGSLFKEGPSWPQVCGKQCRLTDLHSLESVQTTVAYPPSAALEAPALTATAIFTPDGGGMDRRAKHSGFKSITARSICSCEHFPPNLPCLSCVL